MGKGLVPAIKLPKVKRLNELKAVGEDVDVTFPEVTVSPAPPISNHVVDAAAVFLQMVKFAGSVTPSFES